MYSTKRQLGQGLVEPRKEFEERQGDLHGDWKGLLGRNGLLKAIPKKNYGAEPAESNTVDEYQETASTRELTPSEVAQQEVENAWELAMNPVRGQRIRLRDAQHVHDDFHELYEHERAKRFPDGIGEIKEATRTEFDLVCLEKQQDVIAELVDAERCLNAAVYYAHKMTLPFLVGITHKSVGFYL